MASMTMTVTSLSGFAAAGFSGSPRRSLIVVKATSSRAAAVPEKVSVSKKEERFNGRRDLVFAAAAAAAVTFAGVAMADEDEPKKGSAEAKKKYAPICVSMPTARICHNIK